jgi:primosomal protein N' (replication factor Y)
VAQRDPLRASAERLRVEFVRRDESAKLKKSERELLSFLELHPGSHNLAETATIVKGASESARALARKELVSLVLESPLAYSSTSEIPKKLNDAQQAAFDALAASVRQQQFQTFLLHGVTGSGKTEVYMRAIEATLAMGRSALLLVPAEQWRRVRSGAATVVVGTRSGVFAPVQKLGLIVVDEEHDGSYKQHETPRYHGRDVAIMRARAVGATVVLGSATPSLESRFNAQKGKYQLLELPDRVQQRPMPTVELVDMREEFLQTRKQQTFSGRLIEAITQKLEIGEQVMLLHNRRGYSSFVACRACGERLECVNCAVTLTFHRGDRRMLCHYCGFSRRPPSVCPKCNSEHIQFLGTGSEKVEDELHQHFPKARIARLDRDTVTGKRQFETILQSFREHRYDILVGTQSRILRPRTAVPSIDALSAFQRARQRFDSSSEAGRGTPHVGRVGTPVDPSTRENKGYGTRRSTCSSFAGRVPIPTAVKSEQQNQSARDCLETPLSCAAESVEPDEPGD